MEVVLGRESARVNIGEKIEVRGKFILSCIITQKQRKPLTFERGQKLDKGQIICNSWGTRVKEEMN